MNKLISVVVTCYNHGKYIEQCLRSIFSQTYQNIELLVINDGSTDNSNEIIERVLQDSPFSHTEYICHENKGIVVTRNQAFDKVSGDFLLFVDSDNFLPENFIASMYRIIEAEKADIVYTKLVNPDNQEVLISQMHFNLELLYKGNFIDNCSLIRRSCIGDVRYDPQLKKMVDYDLFMNLIVNKGAKAVSCEETCIYYRVLDNSVSHHGDTRKFYEAYVPLISKYLHQYPKYAQEALAFNFQRVINEMDVFSPYVLQNISIYYASDLDSFSEEKRWTFPFEVRGSISFSLPKEVRYIRIDLTENVSYFSSVTLQNVSTQTELIPFLSNGKSIEQGFIFSTSDPQLYYRIDQFVERNFRLDYEFFNINKPLAPDFIGQVLKEKQSLLEHMTTQFYQYKQALLRAERQYDELSKQHKHLIVEYHKVIGSRRWIIPTKLINFFRRKK